jgi:hypothetical protein
LTLSTVAKQAKTKCDRQPTYLAGEQARLGRLPFTNAYHRDGREKSAHADLQTLVEQWLVRHPPNLNRSITRGAGGSGQFLS